MKFNLIESFKKDVEYTNTTIQLFEEIAGWYDGIEPQQLVESALTMISKVIRDIEQGNELILNDDTWKVLAAITLIGGPDSDVFDTIKDKIETIGKKNKPNFNADRFLLSVLNKSGSGTDADKRANKALISIMNMVDGKGNIVNKLKKDTHQAFINATERTRIARELKKIQMKIDRIATQIKHEQEQAATTQNQQKPRVKKQK